MGRLEVPTATYRLQFNQQFRFENAREIVSYLRRAGISDLYASPIFKARQGSSHGYDVIDPSSLNPELGTEQNFEELSQELKANGMGIILDIVPNHLAASQENPWWMDLLENGPVSPYASFFDVDWHPICNAMENRVLLPILSKIYKDALENQEILLLLDKDSFFIQYNTIRLPVDIKSYGFILSQNLNLLESGPGVDLPVLQQIKQLVSVLEHLPDHSTPHPDTLPERYRERQSAKATFRYLVSVSPGLKTSILETVARFNGKKGYLQSFNYLDKLLAQQSYQLAYWKTALNDINYRRFFDISDLIGIRVEEPQVFEAMHALVLKLVREEKITGLRIDHIDGLHDPFEYLRHLQLSLDATRTAKTGKHLRFYVVVEKVLTGTEMLPEKWPVSGTTGYDFLKAVNGLFVDAKGIQAMETAHRRFTGSLESFAEQVYKKKKYVIKELFAGELNCLGNQLARLAKSDRYAGEVSPRELTKSLAEVTACLDVYRTYTRNQEISAPDRKCLENTVKETRQRNPSLDNDSLAFLNRVLLLDFPQYLPPDQRYGWLRFVMRWQQFTGPVMAKGFEDTALYNYNRLISLNEVGGDPAAAYLSIEAFHSFNTERQIHWPLSVNATSTHDTKRSEDVRARISVISEIPEIWEQHLTRWSRLNQNKKRNVNGILVPEPEMEVLIYQTLIGAWPLSEEEIPEFKDRLKAYMVKAVREAKVSTSWLSPNLEYERAITGFIESILDSSDQNRFLEDFQLLQSHIAYYGALNSLSQVVLKITSPGIPDFYQGLELWDFSLTDPDNRRPVDFQKRLGYLDDIAMREEQERLSLVHELLSNWKDGRIKLYVTYRSLKVRRTYEDVFIKGTYTPLRPQGQSDENICAFVRCHDQRWALVAVPRILTRLVDVGNLPIGEQVWAESTLPLPERAPEYWLNIFTGESVETLPDTKELRLSDIFLRFPAAVLVNVQ